MNNFEKIKSLTFDEMAELIGNLYSSDNWCDKCAEQFDDCYSVGQGCHCIQFAKQWLQAESEG